MLLALVVKNSGMIKDKLRGNWEFQERLLVLGKTDMEFPREKDIYRS